MRVLSLHVSRTARCPRLPSSSLAGKRALKASFSGRRQPIAFMATLAAERSVIDEDNLPMVV